MVEHRRAPHPARPLDDEWLFTDPMLIALDAEPEEDPLPVRNQPARTRRRWLGRVARIWALMLTLAAGVVIGVFASEIRAPEFAASATVSCPHTSTYRAQPPGEGSAGMAASG